jgi:hypothetical protein
MLVQPETSTVRLVTRRSRKSTDGFSCEQHCPQVSKPRSNLNPTLLTLAVIGISTMACKDPYTKDIDPIPPCTPLPGEPCDDETGGEGAEEADDAADEVGDETGDEEPTELGPGECRHNYDENDPVVGIQYQCEGDLFTSLSFTVDGDDCLDLLGEGWCNQSFTFGVNFQPYAAAEVIACCGEYDYEYAATIREYCAYDMYQQLCISLSERLQAAINDDMFGPYDDEAAEIQVWIADHYHDCFNALNANNSATLPEVVSHWNLGTFGDLEDVSLNIEAPTELLGANLPVDEAEWLSCNSANGNNDQVFEDAHTPDGGIVIGVDLAANVDIVLVGPSIMGGTVTASATFEHDCGPRGCPAAEFSFDSVGSQFTLEEFDVFEDDAVAITNGTASLTADRLQIRLWTQAAGYEVLDPTSGLLLGYEIPAGAAQFVISGLTADVGSNRFMTVNSTDMWISESRGIWNIDTFDLEFTDGKGGLWTVTIDDSRWIE